MLHGRGAECALLDGLVEAAQRGGSGAAVVEGEAGIGKTALLEHAAARARALAMPVLRATGVQAESELGFAALSQLLRPVLGRVAALPGPQREALRAALGLAPGSGGDRFLVASAVLTLLSEVGAPDGVLCLVDDAQWIDGASADALLFAARRLGADGVAMVFGVRRGADRRIAAPELAVVELGGLGRADVGALLAAHARRAPIPAVRDRLAVATGGNPLALRELAGLLSMEQLGGRAPLPDPLPLTEGLERAFLTQVRALPADAQLVLLLAGADTTGALATVTSAAARLGLDAGTTAEAMAAAEAGGLLRAGEDGVAFRHPLVRSAVLASASFTQLRRVHAALADALAQGGDREREVWHRAAAAIGPEEGIAAGLEAAAARATARAAPATAATTLMKAAELSPDAGTRVRRYLGAARAAWSAALPEQAYAALDAARPLTTDPLALAELAQLHGLFELRRGNAAEAHRLLLDGADLVAGLHPALAVDLLAMATEAAFYVGDTDALLAAARRAAVIDPGDDPRARACRDYAIGIGETLGGNPGAAAAALRRVREGAEGSADPSLLIYGTSAALFLGDMPAWGRMARRAVGLAREGGATGILPRALEALAGFEVLHGRYEAAAALATEGLELARETAQDTPTAVLLGLLAWSAASRGDEDACRALAEEALALGLPRRLGMVSGLVGWALAWSDLLHGRYPEALQRMTTTVADAHPATTLLIMLPNRVEAAVRCGQREAAQRDLAELQGWAANVRAARLDALVLRCRALLDDGPGAELLFQEALGTHPLDNGPMERGRTALLYGEWLRRARRRVEAREQLRAALEVFDRIGCAPLAERARRELRATGETLRRHDPGALARLTPQELQITRLVGAGASNRDVATRLFLSPRTVEYHLHKVYPKLGVASRAELAHLVAGESLRADGTA